MSLSLSDAEVFCFCCMMKHLQVVASARLNQNDIELTTLVDAQSAC